MLPTKLISELKIHVPSEQSKLLAAELSCSPLVAEVITMLKGNQDISSLREWMQPNFAQQMNSLDLGMGSKEATALWKAKNSFGNVLVYGDYDVDGISSTVLAMEIFRNKAAQVRYFIPRRDVHGYGLNKDIVDKIPGWGCNTLVVVDCGTNDSVLLEGLKNSGIDVFVFDHHSVSSPITIPAVVNPSIDMDAGDHQKICATAVLWCWAWKENIVPKQFLQYEVDLPALATIADCMPLHNLNRLLIRYGLYRMRVNPRRGLCALFERLRINKSRLTEEHLSMRVIPCLNAPGRIATADPSVRVLLGTGSNDSIYSYVGELMRINKKRQLLTESIARTIDDGILTGGIHGNVVYDASWPIGVLSGVASRICAQYNRPIVLAAPVGGRLVRGTLRVPEGGDAVGLLRQISDRLEAWGGHKRAAGFSVLLEDWPSVKRDLERMLSALPCDVASQLPVIKLSPADLTVEDWRAIVSLGPFGGDTPLPKFYVECEAEKVAITAMGREGRHSVVTVDGCRLLAFGTRPELLPRFGAGGDSGGDDGTGSEPVKPDEAVMPSCGVVYHARGTAGGNAGEEELQLILDCTVERGGG